MEPIETIQVPHLGGIDVGYRLSKSPRSASKPTLVLLCPFTTTADYYAPDFKNGTLREAANLLAIEPLGHGRTRIKTTESFTYWDTAIVALQVLSELGFDKAFALGTSQGGWVAARMALIAPERIKGIIPIGSSMDSESARSRERGCWDGPVACSDLVTLAGNLAPAADFEPGEGYCQFLMDIGYGKTVDQPTKDFWSKSLTENYRGDGGKRRMCMAAVTLAGRDGLHERLPYIKCPVLWLQGNADVVFSLKNAQDEIKLFNNSVSARVVPFEGGVHFLSWTHEKEVNQQILEFIRKWDGYKAALYLHRLEERLGNVEKALGQVRGAQAAIPTTPLHKTSEDRDAGRWESRVGSQASPSLVYQDGGGIGEIDTVEDSIDGMGAIKFTDEEDWGYFGPSSNIAFLRHISLALARAVDLPHAFPLPSNHASAVSGGVSISRPHTVDDYRDTGRVSRQRGGVNIYALPPETRTWNLIKEYFQKTGQLLPFVHEESFCAAYFEMKRNNFTKTRRTWLGLLNIILAMAATLQVEESVSAGKRIEESDVYFQRANGLCDKESRRNISLELVQYLLILGQYLQGTQKSVQAWTVHGLAVTTALQLGLHSPKTNKGFSPLEGEIRKRAWFGCILLDRTLSMTFGRPAMVPESYLKLELPTSTLQVIGQTPQPQESPQIDALAFTATIKLYTVMHRIIDTCYGQNLGLEEYRTEPEIIASVLKVEEELDRWRAQLAKLQMRVYDVPMTPENLENKDLEDKIMERFVNVLSVRYHNLQILLHRPILEKFLEACGCGAPSTGNYGRGRGKVQQVGIGNVETCVHSAVVIISIVHTVVGSTGWKRDLLGAWNYSLFYTFNAGLVIFAAMHIARNEIQNDHTGAARWDFVKNALPYFTKAIEALENLDPGNLVVQRCRSYLSQLDLLPISGSPVDQMALNYNRQASTDVSRNGDANVRGPYDQHCSTHVAGLGTAPGQVPMEIDLNEFMLDTDFDFFARAF